MVYRSCLCSSVRFLWLWSLFRLLLACLRIITQQALILRCLLARIAHSSPHFRAMILTCFSDAVLLPAFPERKQGKANQKEHRGYGKADQEGGYHVLAPLRNSRFHDYCRVHLSERLTRPHARFIQFVISHLQSMYACRCLVPICT